MRAVLALAFLIPLTAVAADPPKKDPEPKKESVVFPGEAATRQYFQRQVKDIQDATLTPYKTKEDWEKARPELKRQLLDMLGLWPLPARTELKPVVTGTVDAPKFTVEKLHFQSKPGLYVMANLYVPKPAPQKAPCILYVCGHGNVIKDGVSFGSKVFYQHHPAWFAEHGYVCMVIDTLQLAEIQGFHHGTHQLGQWWWQGLGHTPAGVECWNAMRAIDYLETRPEVDAKRVGVTGRSGGGAYSWWITATDERVACAVPVAGIADLQSHLLEGYPGRFEKGVIAGHCDCMFMVNTYRWDFATVAAMCAPRPVLLGNSDADDIFPVPGYRRLAEKTRHIYGLLGAADKFALLETKGPHMDTPELRAGAFQWLNRWLKNDNAEVKDPTPATKFEPAQLKVFAKIPEDERNTRIQETFVPAAVIEAPKSSEVAKAWWPAKREEMLKELREHTFRNWPKEVDLATKPAGDKTHDGVRLRAWDFISETGVELRLWLMTAATTEKPALVVLNALTEADWKTWCADLGPEFAEVLQVPKTLKQDEAKFKQNKAVMEKMKWAFAAVCPRGVGPTRFAEAGSRDEIQYRRRFALIGQTWEGQQVWDVRRAFQTLGKLGELKDVPRWLQGKQDMATVALFAALFEPAVARLDLWQLAPTFKTAPPMLNAWRHLDIPQALALAHPMNVKLYVKDEAARQAWAWPLELQKALGKETLQLRVVGE